MYSVIAMNFSSGEEVHLKEKWVGVGLYKFMPCVFPQLHAQYSTPSLPLSLHVYAILQKCNSGLLCKSFVRMPQCCSLLVQYCMQMCCILVFLTRILRAQTACHRNHYQQQEALGRGPQWCGKFLSPMQPLYVLITVMANTTL